MKRISIFLIKVHRFYYLLLGALIGLIVLTQVKNVEYMIPRVDINPFVLTLLIIGVCFIEIFSMGFFYAGENLANQDIDPSVGRIKWDNYFPLKIDTEMSVFKRFCGYIYVSSRTLYFLACGYILCAMVCIVISK